MHKKTAKWRFSGFTKGCTICLIMYRIPPRHTIQYPQQNYKYFSQFQTTKQNYFSNPIYTTIYNPIFSTRISISNILLRNFAFITYYIMENQNENNENQNQNEGLTAEQIAANESAAAEAAKNTPPPITDEVLFSEISKRYENIKSKEDLDKYVSFNPEEHIKPKNELVRKLNDWAGEPEQYLKIAKLDVEKLDNKSAIIQDMIIKEGLTERVAELQFNKRFGAAFVPEKDEDDRPNEKFNKDEKELAEFELNKAAVESKKNLSSWRASTEEQGFRKPTAEDIALAAEKFQKEWVQPVKQAVADLQKISTTPSYQLHDKTDVAEPFSYTTDNADTKKVVEEIMAAPSTEVFVQKFMEAFGKDENGKASLSKLAENLTFLKERDSFVSKAMAVAASKGAAHVIQNVRPGNLKDHKASGEMNPTGTASVIAAMNKAFAEQRK